MKKIATITFHNAINIGAVLQTYALQKTIRSMGHETEVIDYRNSHLQAAYSPFYLKHKTPIWIAKTVLVAPIRFIRNQRFVKFNRKFVKVSERIITDADFAKVNDTYDAFFVGSDQVWNPYLAGKVDGKYFLDFVTDSRKKKSYAASFGLAELPKEFEAEYKKYLSDFSDVSVREQSAVQIVRKLNASLNPVHVLDPVFLLNATEWNEMAISPSKKLGQYLLIFCVSDLTDDIVEYSTKFAKKNGLEPIYLARRPQRITGVKVVINFAPQEFLGYIQNAQHIVTDSFHAMSFSIMFNKEFSLKVTKQKGLKNNRPLELLERLDIHNRTLDDNIDAIDWKSVGEKLDIEKKKSFNFLKDSIEKL